MFVPLALALLAAAQDIPAIQAQALADGRFTLFIPPRVAPGQYQISLQDLKVVPQGVDGAVLSPEQVARYCSDR